MALNTAITEHRITTLKPQGGHAVGTHPAEHGGAGAACGSC